MISAYATAFVGVEVELLDLFNLAEESRCPRGHGKLLTPYCSSCGSKSRSEATYTPRPAMLPYCDHLHWGADTQEGEFNLNGPLTGLSLIRLRTSSGDRDAPWILGVQSVRIGDILDGSEARKFVSFEDVDWARDLVEVGCRYLFDEGDIRNVSLWVLGECI